MLVACHGQRLLQDDEWLQLVKRICRCDRRAVLISTLGAEPDAEQRHQLEQRLKAIGPRAPRIAVLTASQAMRWAHIARSLVARLDARAFAFEAVEPAARFLGCRAPCERLQLARDRAHYLLEKRLARATAARLLETPRR